MCVPSSVMASKDHIAQNMMLPKEAALAQGAVNRRCEDANPR